MADLRKSQQGVNLLVTVLDRHQYDDTAAGGYPHQMADFQVDHRDPQGRTQTNPHLALDETGGNGTSAQRMPLDYVDQVAQVAGSSGALELRDLNGQRVGMLYAVKADIEPMPGAPLGRGVPLYNQHPIPESLRPSDYGAQLGDLEARQAQTQWARSPENRAAVMADRDLNRSEFAAEWDRLSDAAVAGIGHTPRDAQRGLAPISFETKALWEQRAAEQKRLMPDLDHGSVQQRGDQPRPPANSQAGLSAMRGSRHSYASVPRPGEVGSRFNPVVRERNGASAQQVAQQANPSLITSADASMATSPRPRTQQRGTTPGRASAKDMASATLRGGVSGAKMGGKAGSVVPAVGTAAGAAIGAGVGANQAQAKVAREAGDKRAAFVTGMPVGGVVGGAVNAHRAGKVRDQRRGVTAPVPAKPGTGAGRSTGDDLVHFQTESGQLISMGKARYAKKGAPDNARRLTTQEHAEASAARASRMQRLKDSTVGQAVQTPEFKDSARRVGSEVVRDAASEMVRAKQSGASGKGVAASAVKGALSGATRGVRTELANRETTKHSEGRKPGQGTAGKTGTDAEIVDRLGQAVKAPQDKQASTPQAGDQGRPLSQRYDYQFETPKEGPGSESQYGG